MRKIPLLLLAAALPLLATEALAKISAITDARTTNGEKVLHAAAKSELEDSKVSPPELFSRSVIDPANCNYQYVDYEGRMVVRSKLKLTCSMSQ